MTHGISPVRCCRFLLTAGLAAGLIGLAAAAGRSAEPRPEASPSSMVRGKDFTLRSTAIDPVFDEAYYPDGPGADIMNANCTACHSASMVQAQPPLSADAWKAIVLKMRDVYRAPVADADIPAIVEYHVRMSDR